MQARPTTSREIVDALKGKYRNPYNGHKWACFEEMRMGTGWGLGNDQRIDLWIMGMWSSNSGREAYEVKISRSDFLHEMKNPAKRRQALRVSNRFWFATPFGLVKPEEIPLECGLIELGYVESNGARKLEQVVTVDAPWRDTAPPNWTFVAALCRRVEQQGD